MTSKHRSVQKETPFLELRIGGLHLPVQRVPYPVLALVTGVAGSMGSAIWLGH
jgi:hypothetical protein